MAEPAITKFFWVVEFDNFVTEFRVLRSSFTLALSYFEYSTESTVIQ